MVYPVSLAGVKWCTWSAHDYTFRCHRCGKLERVSYSTYDIALPLLAEEFMEAHKGCQDSTANPSREVG